MSRPKLENPRKEPWFIAVEVDRSEPMIMISFPSRLRGMATAWTPVVSQLIPKGVDREGQRHGTRHVVIAVFYPNGQDMMHRNLNILEELSVLGVGNGLPGVSLLDMIIELGGRVFRGGQLYEQNRSKRSTKRSR